MLPSEIETEQSAPSEMETEQSAPSGMEMEQGAGVQSSDLLTTGRTPVVTNRQDILTTGRMPVVMNRQDILTTGRMPIVIPGAGKGLSQRTSATPVKTQHRILLHASVVFVLAVFMLTTLLAVLPLGKDGQALGVGGFLQNLGVMNLINSNSKNTALVGAQAATATAIMQQDGYTPPKAVAQQYNASLGISSSNNSFPYGQCTWWADERYHQLTGYYVPWTGNAYQWAYNAPSYGWVVSSTPHIPSIMVFQPGVQYASSTYGHVAIAESINSDGSIRTSNMNVYGYPFGTVAYLTNYAGSGVSFVYHL